ncbi:MAG: glycosyltransferase family 39 protein [Dysgonamonadaceae bacterium]|jgi:hypothetical protein|nr:glycosyltransferase family 39 protein [Dysgonamonadaceae bacterium]
MHTRSTGNKKTFEPKDWQSYLILFVGSVILLYLSPLAPFANKISGYDSSVFIYNASQILDGKVLYRDLFDHKGPLLYALDTLGLLLGIGNSTGIWFVEWAALAIALTFIYRSMRLFFLPSVSLLATLSCLLFEVIVFCQGNLAEEYSIPFIAATLYYFLRFFKEQNFRWQSFFIIAVCFTCVFLIKPNATVVWGVGWLLVTIFLLKAKRGADWLRVAGASAIGVVICLLPFVIYWIATGSWEDVRFCYWDFNKAYSEYANQKGLWDTILQILIRTGERLFVFSAMWTCFTCVFFGLSILLFFILPKRHILRWPIGLYILSVLATALAISISDTNFFHYYLLFVPVFAGSFALVYDFIRRCTNRYALLVSVVILFACHWELVSLYRRGIYYCFRDKPMVTGLVSYIDNQTRPDEPIYILGNACLFYNLSHRTSASRYAFLAPIVDIKKYRPMIINGFFEDMQKNPPKLIVYQTSWLTDLDWIVHEDIPGLNAFLEDNYIKTQTFEQFDCWLRK